MSDQFSRPTDAELHAYKAVHQAEYLRATAEAAGGTNRLIHTTELPTEGTDPVVTPALDHLYRKQWLISQQDPFFSNSLRFQRIGTSRSM